MDRNYAEWFSTRAMKLFLNFQHSVRLNAFSKSMYRHSLNAHTNTVKIQAMRRCSEYNVVIDQQNSALDHTGLHVFRHQRVFIRYTDSPIHENNESW